MNLLDNTNNIGIGTDIESIERFKMLDISDDSHFLNKIFTQTELDYCFAKSNPAQHLAARYSGKESIVKAFHNLVDQNIGLNNIEIINNSKGVPKAKINLDGFNAYQILLSLSHCEDKAIAFAVVIKNDNK